MDADDLTRARDFIAGETWTFAKTVPEAPHWYVMVFDANDPDGYQWFGRLITEHGIKRRWRIPGTERWLTNTYLTLDGHDYWFIARGRGTPSLNRRAAVPLDDPEAPEVT